MSSSNISAAEKNILARQVAEDEERYWAREGVERLVSFDPSRSVSHDEAWKKANPLCELVVQDALLPQDLAGILRIGGVAVSLLADHVLVDHLGAAFRARSSGLRCRAERSLGRPSSSLLRSSRR